MQKKNPVASDNTFKFDTQNRFILLASPDAREKPSSEPQENPSLASSSHAPSSPWQPSIPMFQSLLFDPPSDKIPVSDAGPLPSSQGKAVKEHSQQPSAMELDAALALSLRDLAKAEDQSSPSIMEEDPIHVSLDGLDIFKLETACKQKEYNSIPPWKIDRLEGVLMKAHCNKSLGIQAGSPWDGKKILKETKKRGCKTDLQRTIIVGEILMESGRFPKLTKFYKPKPHCPS